MHKKTILVPVDFSEDSVNALDMAIAITGRIQAGIHMLYVKPEKSFFSIFGGGKEEYSEPDIELNFKKLLDKYAGKGVDIQSKTRFGKIYKEIVSEAETLGAYLVIMGTHGVSGFEDFWIGSNTYKVVSHSPCPVLSLRKTFTRRTFENIILPLDNTPETRQKVPFLIDFVCNFNSKIHVLAVMADEGKEVRKKLEGYQQQVCSYLTDENCSCVTNLVIGDNIATEILHYAEKVKADLVCIMTEQEPDDDNLILGAYAQQVVNNSIVPVLSIRPGSDVTDELV